MKRILAMLLAITLLFTSGGEILAAELANNNQNGTTRKTKETIPTGYMAPEGIGIPAVECVEEDATGASVSKYSKVYNHDWDKYSTNYYYNQLSKDEKALWDALDKVCIHYLEEKETVSTTLSGVAVLDSVPVSFKMSVQELHEFWQIFMLSNPQYYFLRNRYYYYYDASGNVQSVHLTIYDAFKDGGKRASATKKIKKQIAKWEDIIKEYDTEAEKVKVIHDLICKKVSYNYPVYEDFYISDEEEAQCFSQSAYSVFCTDLTVCAGYSDTMAMMCNGAGLDAVSVTSYDHQWNKVRINDVWYNYDLTRGDANDDAIYYGAFARSDAESQKDGSSYIEEAFWADYLPKAKLDTAPSDPWSAPGTYPTISKQTKTPLIQVTRTDKGYTVKITCDTKKAKIYYTTDGTEPSVASTKSTEYSKAFKLSKTCTVKAIAVYDGYKDSKVASQKINEKAASIEKAKVKLSKSKYTYDGETKKPTATVTLDGKELKKNKDYTVSYKNNKNIGKATVTITGINNYEGKVKKTFTIAVKTGKTFTSGSNKYKVTTSSTVSFMGLKNTKATKVTIPKTVKYGGKSFKVTAIADNALKGNTKIKTVTIEKNVKTIGKQAFLGCKNLKTITVKSVILEKAGKNALKSIHKKATIKVPKSKLKEYQKLLKKKGQGSKVKIVSSK